MKCSFIVAIDNSMALVSNFLFHLCNSVTDTDEIIIISDGCNDIETIGFLEKESIKHPLIKLIKLKRKVGFGAANNIGIANATGETLFFINSDILVNRNCIENMLTKLWSQDNIGAVQPLLLYPQNNLVQSTGHVFSDYRSGQLFNMRKATDNIVQKSGPRQALTMALCAVKKEVVSMLGGFNEYYYNSHEGLEFTLKITLNNYICYYCADAVAYHCTSAARKNTLYDVDKQKSYFYNNWSQRIDIDLPNYLNLQISEINRKKSYYLLNFSTSRLWKSILRSLEVSLLEETIFEERFVKEINLFYCLPASSINYPGVYLFLCDNIAQLKSNHRWFCLRKRIPDIIMDLDGNIICSTYFL